MISQHAFAVVLVLVSGASVLIGCSSGALEETFSASFAVRDSAGVLVAESRDSAWTQHTAWQVDAEPFLQIGSKYGEAPGTGFGQGVQAVRLSDGRIAVGDAQTLEIRLFDADGTFVGTWGGRGSGPGELQRLDKLAVIRGDSLMVRQEGLLRHEVYAPDGSWGRSVTAPQASLGSGATVAGWFEDGGFIMGPFSVNTEQRSPGRHLIDGEWHLFDETGGHVGLLARLPHRLMDVRGVPALPKRISYGPMVQSATDATGLWHAFPTSYELHHVGRGGVDRLIRRSWSPEVVPTLLKERYQAWYETSPSFVDAPEGILPEYVPLRRAGAERNAMGRSEEMLAFADTLPAFLRLVVARNGYLWVESYATVAELLAGQPADIATGRWTVFDPDGRWLGTVVMPEGLRIMEIGSDYVLGVWLDELDIPFVRLHRIRRN